MNYGVLWFLTFIIVFVMGFPSHKDFNVKLPILSTLKAHEKLIENKVTSTPFLDSVIETAASIATNKRFFFPGHSGGLHSPKLNFNLSMDLPELDEIDSVHSPGVSLYIYLSSACT